MVRHKRKKGIAQLVTVALSVVVVIAVLVFGAIFVAALQNTTSNTSTAYTIAGSGLTQLSNIMTYVGLIILAIVFGLAIFYLVRYFGGLGGKGGE
jgi:heme/copper-type cytochrome/quinol oxidase subunit 2